MTFDIAFRNSAVEATTIAHTANEKENHNATLEKVNISILARTQEYRYGNVENRVRQCATLLPKNVYDLAKFSVASARKLVPKRYTNKIAGFPRVVRFSITSVEKSIITNLRLRHLIARAIL